jgi:transcriptional regulator with XRE-family HTH domain
MGTNPRAPALHVLPQRLKEDGAMAILLREVIGDVLRRARTSQGRTLREVSDSARVSLGYLSEVERGRKEASSELLSAICTALDVPMSRVLYDAGAELACHEGVTRLPEPTTVIAHPAAMAVA